jgi:hypothetical protein
VAAMTSDLQKGIMLAVAVSATIWGAAILIVLLLRVIY